MQAMWSWLVFFYDMPFTMRLSPQLTFLRSLNLDVTKPPFKLHFIKSQNLTPKFTFNPNSNTTKNFSIFFFFVLQFLLNSHFFTSTRSSKRSASFSSFACYRFVYPIRLNFLLIRLFFVCNILDLCELGICIWFLSSYWRSLWLGIVDLSLGLCLLFGQVISSAFRIIVTSWFRSIWSSNLLFILYNWKE
jgi:hypothetical protein